MGKFRVLASDRVVKCIRYLDLVDIYIASSLGLNEVIGVISPKRHISKSLYMNEGLIEDIFNL